jgi:hypothetical protein
MLSGQIVATIAPEFRLKTRDECKIVSGPRSSIRNRV